MTYEVKCLLSCWETLVKMMEGTANGTGVSGRHRLSYHAVVPTDQCRPQTTLLNPRQQTHHPKGSLEIQRRRLRARRRQTNSRCTSRQRALLLRVRKRTRMRPPYRPPNFYLRATQRICRKITSHLRFQTSKSGRHNCTRAPPH
jgi:hypothetical protein